MPKISDEKRARLKKDILEEIDKIPDSKTKAKKAPAQKPKKAPAKAEDNIVMSALPKKRGNIKIEPRPKIITASKPLTENRNIKKPIVKKTTNISIPVTKPKKKPLEITKPKIIQKPKTKKPLPLKTILAKSGPVRLKNTGRIKVSIQKHSKIQKAKITNKFKRGDTKPATLPDTSPILLTAGSGHKFPWIACSLGVVAIILVILLTIAFGAYKLGWDNKLVQQTSKILNLPAGSINQNNISLAKYLDDIKILNNIFEAEPKNIYSDNRPIEERVFERMISEQIILSELARYNIKITTDDLDKQLDIVVDQMSGLENATLAIKETYNLSLDQFKNKILKFLLAKDLLSRAVLNDGTLDITKETREEAKNVLALALLPDMDFAVLANEYTDDEAGIGVGGDLGWISKNEVAPDLEKILFSMPTNTVYSDLIKNSYGYHIFKVEERLEDTAEERESVHARHILIKLDIDRYIKSLMDGAVIKKYVK